jgi:hypothetical protein
LFEEDDSKVFCILDGASIPDLLDHLYSGDREFECLYRGELQPDLAEAAPYLVALPRSSDLTRWILERGWGGHWGIFVRSSENLGTLRRHFRRFLMVHDSNAKPLYFRFYDPRVLRVYLPTCNSAELTAIFGPIDAFIIEDEDGKAVLNFRNNSGVLALSKEELKEDG